MRYLLNNHYDDTGASLFGSATFQPQQPSQGAANVGVVAALLLNGDNLHGLQMHRTFLL